MRRTAAGVLLSGLAALVMVVPATAAQAQDLYVYGHSYTNGARLADPATGYTRLLASDRHEVLHSFGRNGSQAYKAAERLYGTGPASWHTGAPGDVLIQANLNTARDFGTSARALATSRNSMRVMLATVDASRRIEDSNHTHRYGGAWHRKKMSWASGGSVHVATRNRSYVQFRAVGGEYVSVRGASGRGIDIRVSDRTAGRTVAHLRTGHRVHPAYDHAGIPLLYRIPVSMAHHVIRLTKQSGRGSFTFDARLPQRPHPGKVILVKEPYLADYSASAAHPHGSNRAMDAFNHVLDVVAREFTNSFTVDLNAAGWDPSTYLQGDGVHPNVAGSRFIADTVEAALDKHSG